jgi:uncharacterized protein (UPF0147 family)
MTFETLKHIHRLLVEEETKTNEAYKAAQERLINLKDENAPKNIRQQAKESMDVFDRIHIKAYRTLDDFESHDWR